MNEPAADLAALLRDVLREEAIRVQPADDALHRIRSRIAAGRAHWPDYETLLAKFGPGPHKDRSITEDSKPMADLRGHVDASPDGGPSKDAKLEATAAPSSVCPAASGPAPRSRRFG
jgi:hypothetical protein